MLDASMNGSERTKDGVPCAISADASASAGDRYTSGVPEAQPKNAENP
jgi:hypothetical protein